MRVLIVDDRSNVRYGLKVLLEALDEVETIAEAVDCGELIHRIQHDCSDLILLSWGLPGQINETLIQSIKSKCPDTHIVIMSSKIGDFNSAFELGADDFISKAEPPEKLLDLIQHYFSNS